jgi:hypothetical protein
MCADASTVLRAVAEDFFFNCWYLEIPSDNRIRQIPRSVHYHAQGFRLETFQNFNVGSGSRTPELCSVSPDWFEYCFICEKSVACGELCQKSPVTVQPEILDTFLRELYFVYMDRTTASVV